VDRISFLIRVLTPALQKQMHAYSSVQAAFRGTGLLGQVKVKKVKMPL
jgi:hypothetical protein